MVEYKEMYCIMFRGIEKARQLLLNSPPSLDTIHEAVRILEKAQLDCDDIFIKSTEIS